MCSLPGSHQQKIERTKNLLCSHQRTSVTAQCAQGFPQQYFPATAVDSDTTSHNAMLGQIFHGNCLCFSLMNEQPVLVDLVFLCLVLCLVCHLPLFCHIDKDCQNGSWFNSILCGFCSFCVIVGTKKSRTVSKRVQMVCLHSWP